MCLGFRGSAFVGSVSTGLYSNSSLLICSDHGLLGATLSTNSHENRPYLNPVRINITLPLESDCKVVSCCTRLMDVGSIIDQS